MSRPRTPASTPAAPETWTPQKVRDLGVTTDLRTAASIFGVAANTAYTMVAAGTFPVPVIRAGSVYRVPVAAILTRLHLPLTDEPATTTAEYAPVGALAPATGTGDP